MGYTAQRNFHWILPMRSALFITLLTFLFAACGQTGPLYLPENTPSTAPEDSAVKPVEQGTSP